MRYKTARLLKHKRMQVMKEDETPRHFSGYAEVDDANLSNEPSEGKPGATHTQTFHSPHVPRQENELKPITGTQQGTSGKIGTLIGGVLKFKR